MDAPDDVVDELYGVPFDEFIARRDARAKELRREKRREEADAVKALRKPALSAWAIDQLVRSDRDAVDGLLAAGAALRQAKGGDTLRDASHDEREAVETLAERATGVLREAGKPVTGKTEGEVRDTLHAAALDEEVRGLLDRGRLVEAHQAIGLGGFALGAAGVAEPEPEPRRETKRKTKATTKTKAKPQPKAEPKPKPSAAARKAVRTAEAALRESERDLRAARREVDDRERDLKRAERALGKAEKQADAAAEAVEAAEEELERRRSELDG